MSTTMTTAEGTVTQRGELRRTRLRAVAAGVLAPLAVWALVDAGFGVDLRAPAGASAEPADLGAGAVVTASAVAALAGWGLLALLERFTTRARTVWAVLAVLVLVVSLGGPLGGTGITAANRIALLLMHLVVAAVLIPALYRTSRTRER